MNTTQETKPRSFDSRLSRSKGRAAREHVAQARVTADEQADILKAARSSGKAVGEWIREVLVREAHREEDPLFIELIATRMILLNLLKPLAMGQQVTTEDFARISATVRKDKRKVAQEIQQQYLPAVPKEA